MFEKYSKAETAAAMEKLLRDIEAAPDGPAAMVTVRLRKIRDTMDECRVVNRSFRMTEQQYNRLLQRVRYCRDCGPFPGGQWRGRVWRPWRCGTRVRSLYLVLGVDR